MRLSKDQLREKFMDLYTHPVLGPLFDFSWSTVRNCFDNARTHDAWKGYEAGYNLGYKDSGMVDDTKRFTYIENNRLEIHRNREYEAEDYWYVYDVQDGVNDEYREYHIVGSGPTLSQAIDNAMQLDFKNTGG
jgi:hypothetical protein